MGQRAQQDKKPKHTSKLNNSICIKPRNGDEGFTLLSSAEDDGKGYKREFLLLEEVLHH